MPPHGGSDSLAQVTTTGVGRRMTANPIAITTADNCLWALRVMGAANVHHLPVLEGERLVGIVTDGDIYRRAPAHVLSAPAGSEEQEALLAHVSVAGVMSYGPVTIDATVPFQDALEVMLAREVGSLLVVDKGRLVGILTERDALRQVLEALHDPPAADGQDGSGETT